MTPPERRRSGPDHAGPGRNHDHQPTRSREIARIIGFLRVSIMVTMMKFGASPLPKPLGLAFAETLAGRSLPLPVGLLFHLAYVTVWSMAFVVLFRNSLSLRNALLLALVLWIGVLVAFFPIVGWGMFGLAIGPMLIPGSFMPHLLFGLFLWGLARLFFPAASRE